MPLVLALLVLSISAASCTAGDRRSSQKPQTEVSDYERKRNRMVSEQIEARGVDNPQVLESMRSVERHLFVPEADRWEAYEDRPLSIGEGQTISQPYIVAFMTQAIKPKKTDRVLEIGTGCGYQAAVLSRVVERVYTIEIIDELAKSAKERLVKLNYKNISVRSGDGYAGWAQEAPFDAIIVTAAPEKIPPKLIEQLKTGGRLIAPVGSDLQDLILVTKQLDGTIVKRNVMAVRFVPMTGEAQTQR